jgi:hypothetical protein
MFRGKHVSIARFVFPSRWVRESERWYEFTVGRDVRGMTRVRTGMKAAIRDERRGSRACKGVQRSQHRPQTPKFAGIEM